MPGARTGGLLLSILGGLAAVSAGGPPPPPSEAWSGLLAMRPQLPGKLPFLAPRLTGGRLPGRGESRWRADLFYTSTLQFTRGVIVSERPDPSLQDVLDYLDENFAATGQDLYYFDGETTRLDLGWTHGMPGGWELGVELPVVRHGGGSLDHTVTRFHNLTGLSDAGRDSAPDGVGAMVLISGEGEYVLTGDALPRAALGDLLLSARFAVPLRARRMRLHLAALAELPTGATGSLAGSGDLDLGTTLALEWPLARWRWTLGFGYSWLGGLDGAPGLPIADTWTATGGAELRLSGRASLVAQLQHSTSPYALLDVDGIAEGTTNLGIGGRFALGDHWLVDVALVEDVLNHIADIDLGLLVSVGWRP